jgi:hypothetical protein
MQFTPRMRLPRPCLLRLGFLGYLLFNRRIRVDSCSFVVTAIRIALRRAGVVRSLPGERHRAKLA